MYPNVEGLLNGTKPVNDREPLIGMEKGTGIILQIDPFQHPEKGFACRARILVHESSGPEAHPAGTVVCSLWFLERRPKFASQTADSDRFADFLAKVTDCTDATKIPQWGGAVLQHRVGDQLLRGYVVKFEGRNVAKAGKAQYVVPSWSTVPQTAEQVTAWRRSLDGTHPVQVRQMQQQVSSPAATSSAAAPQNYGQAPSAYPQQPQSQPQMYPQVAPIQQAQPQQAPATAPVGPGYPVPPGYGR